VRERVNEIEKTLENYQYGKIGEGVTTSLSSTTQLLAAL
jgi:hypothetical protein